MLRSALCTTASIDSPELLAWADRLRPAWDLLGTGAPTSHNRKLWEWFYIARVLEERDMLREGRRGLGFGVGTEPLAALFASFGCEIVATDVAADVAERGGWVGTGQHAGELEALQHPDLCDRERFTDLVTFRTVDMNQIPDDLRGFDFTWSSCAIEHIGSLGHSQEFLLAQTACLRPGGVGVHTTEYNLSSNVRTVEVGQTVLFRARDVEWVARRLHRAGHRIEVDLEPGDAPDDHHVDVTPYTTTHLRVRLHGFVTTSFAFVIERNRFARPDHDDLDQDAVRVAHRARAKARVALEDMAAAGRTRWEENRPRAERLVRRVGGRARRALPW